MTNPSALRSPTRQRRADLPARPLAAAAALPASHVALIDRSHARCAALGLTRIERPDPAPLGRSDLGAVRDRNRRLFTHAAPLMEMLVEQIVGTESMVVLCDATGTIIHSIGDDDFLARASKVALQPGVDWSEPAKGTNAIGTALVDEVPTLVHADEHYLHANHFLTCSAAPILDPRGSILGVLDVTGDHRSYHQHTMALVKMSARMIENHWLSDDFQHALRLHFHGRAEFLGTLMEGILAVTPDGRIVGANRSALEQLGLSGAALRMTSLVALFGTSVGALVDRFRSPLAGPLLAHTVAGDAYHLHARFNWPVWSTVTEAVAAVVPAAGMPTTTVTPSRGRAGPGRAAAPDAAPRSRPAARVPLDAFDGSDTFDALDTGDPAFGAVLQRLRRVRDRGLAILLRGETGCGKAALARAIHADSARAARPFVAVRCAAIPPAQFESELFGDAGDAAAGAPRAATVGRLQQADGGTLFLDGVDALPVALQARLLQVLDERRFTPAGADRPRPLDVALVSATTADLRARVDGGRFREDLLQRIGGLTLTLPPLRDRRDLDALARRLLDADPVGRPLALAPEALARLRAQRWPGNLRELANVLRSAALLADGGDRITLEHLPDDGSDGPAGGAVRPAAGHADGRARDGAVDGARDGADDATARAGGIGDASLATLEHDAIRRAVEAAGGNISQAARRLGVSRNTIYRRLRWPRAGV